MFGPGNPWFQEKMALSVDDPTYREGYAMLFNLRKAHAASKTSSEKSR